MRKEVPKLARTMTDVHRDTILRLMVRVAKAGAMFSGQNLRELDYPDDCDKGGSGNCRDPKLNYAR